MTDPASPCDIAAWMKLQLDTRGILVQSAAVLMIMKQFGPEHAYRNKNGNWAINPNILAEFRKLTSDTAVWSRGSQQWVLRRDHHPPGKRMID